MAIGPIDYAMIQRTNDVEMYKMQEETKPFVDQQNIQVQVAAHESKQTKNDADARKEGRGHYFSQQRKKKQERETNGKVVRKLEHSGFDMKI